MSKNFSREILDLKTADDIEGKLKSAFSTDNYCDEIEDLLIPQYGWECVQQALFHILLDDNNEKDVYNAAADVFWCAVTDKYKIPKRTAVALLYYRLGDIANPYENNTIWSIAAELYGLDYCNSEWNPLKDKKILKELADYGIQLG